jgi:putative transposase
MRLTQKIRIFLTLEQERVLWVLSEKCRLIYNFALAERIDAWNKGKNVNYIRQQNDLPCIKEKYPEYKYVYAKVLQMTLRTLDADYKSFYSLWKKGDRKAKPPKFKGKNHFTTMIYNQSGFKIENGKVSLSHFYNSTPLEFTIPEKFKFGKVYQVSVSMKDGKYYLSIVYDEPTKGYVDNGKYVAIDLGVSNIVTAVNIDGKFIQIKNKRVDKYWQPKIEKLQSRRDHCKKGSRRWYKLNTLLKKCKRKCANQLRDFQHKLSTKLVKNTRANAIIVGKLNAKQLSKCSKGDKKADRSLHRATQNTGLMGRFVQFLTYKAERVGKRVIEIDGQDTTKMCCVCGKKQKRELWERSIKCECGNEVDRDKNSAVNIMVRYLSQNALVNGLDTFVSNLRQTGLLIGSYSQEAFAFRQG